MLSAHELESNQEWAKPYRDASSGLEFLHAHFVSYAFARHTHEEYVVAYVEQGVDTHFCRGITHQVTAGDIIIVNPDEIHTGKPAVSEGFTYRVIYPTVAFLRKMTPGADLPVGAIPHFKTPVIRDLKLAVRAAAFHQALARHAPQLELDSRLYGFLGSLLGAYSDVVAPNDRLKEHQAVTLTLEYLNEHYAQNITLEAIASHTQLSPFHLQRVFKHSTGLSPYEYQAQVRVYQARNALRDGESISSSATRVGLFDQSHLNRHFKRIFGFTPGKYRESLGSDRQQLNRSNS